MKTVNNRPVRYKTSVFGLVWRVMVNPRKWFIPEHTLPLKAERMSQAVKYRSVFIRHIDGGSCGAAEQEIAALFNPTYDAEQFGFHLVASPRHADLLLVTGPLTCGMVTALRTAFQAMPEPRRIITVGDDFEPESPFTHSYAVTELDDDLKAACIAHIPGDPPSPTDILNVLLSLEM